MNLTNLLQDILQDKTSPGMAPETIILPTSQKLYEVDLSTRMYYNAFFIYKHVV